MFQRHLTAFLLLFKNQEKMVSNSEEKSTSSEKVNCDACPILCRISPGKTGSCDRYGNFNGKLQRIDPVILTQNVIDQNEAVVPFEKQTKKWDGSVLNPESIFPTALGAGTTYPDYKPAPFIIASRHNDVDMVTVVTEGIFSYCSYKIKIDTDRYIGPELSLIHI